MTFSALRPPMPLVQTDENACQSCVIAQARWMLGLSHAQGAPAVRETDRLIGRKPGEPVTNVSSLALLLSEGCEVVVFGPEPDMRRLRREGLAYFAEWRGAEWDAEEAAWWTPERFAAYLKRAEEGKRDFDRLRARYRHTLSVCHEDFTAARARTLIRGGWLVIATAHESDGSVHAVLLHGLDSFGFNVYYPSPHFDGLAEIAHPDADTSIRRFAEAVRLPR